MKIKIARLNQNLTQSQLAKKVGVSRQYIRLIENHIAKNPNNELMKKISNELNKTVQELFFED
ncbi:helix-turn-helix transcriptional regulator [Clostridium sp.]|uniref:helix-turn-helix transcriptional regulator n=1 Tax=Clostridium TaxID=1485 RepID=UPI0029028878|nr:helix-turn-helix transcriptional regulator [Clostridium sp.]MDU1825428.1 helix-turn-helix transcriptional regulator [Clostridium sp.]MDU1843350.1 helix-turn-helix transcriptional regulator [Clostridium sp.]MDU2692199.1 helix-turn-helix transcriptional regulator [Clostridium sp.]MDU2958449.1 helix-turn-helix transcriptional regulator [Clostridium sp.]MDU3109230.1 helix-turn-helix transcriptional regulator [Clostridium sp.]